MLDFSTAYPPCTLAARILCSNVSFSAGQRRRHSAHVLCVLQVTLIAVDKALLQLIPNPLPYFSDLFDIYQSLDYLDVSAKVGFDVYIFVF